MKFILRSCRQFSSSLGSLGLLTDGLGLLTESIAELPADNIQGPHATSSSSLPPASLDGPAELPDLGPGVTTGRTYLLLDVVRNLSTSPADGMSLVAPLSKGAGSLGHGDVWSPSTLL